METEQEQALVLSGFKIFFCTKNVLPLKARSNPIP